MDDIASLRRLLAEEQARRKAAERRVVAAQARIDEELARRREEQAWRKEEIARREEEQALREEEEARRKKAESDALSHRSQHRTLEYFREEDKRRLLEEQSRRKEAERALSIRPLKLLPYLEACHSLSAAIQVVTDPSTTTTNGIPIDPAGRAYPRRIVPWVDFPERLVDTWNQVLDPSFVSRHQFPSQHQLDYVRSILGPIRDEQELRAFGSLTVENAVKKLVDAVHDNPMLRARLGLQGTVTFGNHPNPVNDNHLSKSLDDTAHNGRYCIYETSDGTSVAKMAIEYRSPHKLAQDVLIKGLESEIQPERDVFNKDDKDVEVTSKALAAAVVTQLFSSMIDKGIQYGYVSTGQAFVFLRIPDDPTLVYYHVSVPELDVFDDDKSRFHSTAVAQVFGLILQSLREEAPPESWHKAAAKLNLWAVDSDGGLSREDEKPCASPCHVKRECDPTPSPIRTLRSCIQIDIDSRRSENSDDKAALPSPTAHQSTHSGTIAAIPYAIEQQAQDEGGAEGDEDEAHPYCTQLCLLSMVRSWPIEKSCPNAESHGPRHLERTKLLRLVRAQMASDDGPGVDAVALHSSGSAGSLLKVRLLAHGYTFVAKGVEGLELERLQHEKKIYERLRSIQGKHVPVCLGLTELSTPYHHDGRVWDNLLLLSWAGRPLYQCVGNLSRTQFMADVTEAFKKLHELSVLHGDAEARNITYNGEAPMIVDFEKANRSKRQPHGVPKPRKRKRGTAQEQRDAPFVEELQSVTKSVSRYFGRSGLEQPSNAAAGPA
ncbi:hypothetical protein SEPCBS119000_003948 [Sporothrix epigloea]|uniref:Protein kinase domain-containing protein n=1 Tax=Sporothrix epigloea TaxID=1892477 RepID=A0ABP0DTI8_9PEZI